MRWVITTVELKKTSTHCSAMWEYRKAKKINKKKTEKIVFKSIKTGSNDFIQLHSTSLYSLNLASAYNLSDSLRITWSISNVRMFIIQCTVGWKCLFSHNRWRRKKSMLTNNKIRALFAWFCYLPLRFRVSFSFFLPFTLFSLSLSHDTYLSFGRSPLSFYLVSLFFLEVVLCCLPLLPSHSSFFSFIIRYSFSHQSFGINLWFMLVVNCRHLLVYSHHMRSCIPHSHLINIFDQKIKWHYIPWLPLLSHLIWDARSLHWLHLTLPTTEKFPFAILIYFHVIDIINRNACESKSKTITTKMIGFTWSLSE